MSLFDEPAPDAPSSPPAPRVVGVSRLTRALAQRLGSFGQLAVEGEIGGLKRAGSGHVYFSLKEGGAVLSCAVWRSRVSTAAPFELAEGMQVVCHGELDVYAPRGTYSLIVERVERRGMGELLARLERLKAELKERGWFDRQRALPSLPTCIGVVTSRDADALQDFLATRSLRWPLYPVRLAHTRVQGPGAAEEVASAIGRLDASGVDVICVLRGGGSIEDLWAFNELPLAEAIWGASVPVVTGVGHETDTTLADLVADRRAHTPTDAGQTVIPERALLMAELERRAAYLAESVGRLLEDRTARLKRVAAARHLQRPDWLLGDRAGELVAMRRRLTLASDARLASARAAMERLAVRLSRQAPGERLAGLGGRLESLSLRLMREGVAPVEKREKTLALAASTLAAVSPFEVLRRGYSITRPLAGGPPLTRAGGTPVGIELETLLAEGSLESVVTRSRPAQEKPG